MKLKRHVKARITCRLDPIMPKMKCGSVKIDNKYRDQYKYQMIEILSTVFR